MRSRLTFGVEFEFQIGMLDHGSRDDPDPLDERSARIPNTHFHSERAVRRSWDALHQEVATRLQEAGLPARTALEINNGWQPWAGGCWVVNQDASIQPPDDGYYWGPVEIQSPPYIFCEDALDAVRLACQALTSSFRANVNWSCGLHVHVGEGASAFDLETLRKFLALVWTFEPALDSLHPPQRRNGKYCPSMRRCMRLQPWYNADPTSSSVEAEDPMLPLLDPSNDSEDGDDLISIASSSTEQAPSALGGLEKILKPRDNPDAINQLLGLVMDDNFHRGAYNLQNLREPYGYDTKRTIEFRQHCATLSGKASTHWIKTVVGILEFVQQCDIEELTDMLVRHARREDQEGGVYDAVDLLRDIGLGEQARYYERKRQKSNERRAAESLTQRFSQAGAGR